MFQLCLAIVCMTLQQCREYHSSVQPALPSVSQHTDIFYWLNPEGLAVQANEHALGSIIETTWLSQWEFVDGEAANWLPWHYYVDSTECSAVLRLDNGFVLRNTVPDYGKFFTGLSILSMAHNDVLLNLESGCEDEKELGLQGANILVDLTTMHQLLANFKQQNIDEGIHIYSPGAFARWLAPYAITETYTMKSKAMTYCSGVDSVAKISAEIPAELNFIRLARPANRLDGGYQVQALTYSGASPHSVQFV